VACLVVLPGAVRRRARVGPGLVLVSWERCHCAQPARRTRSGRRGVTQPWRAGRCGTGRGTTQALASLPCLAVGAEWEQRSAASWGQTRSDTVIVAIPNSLTCGNAVKQRLCSPERSVRDEEAAGSNPATPTQSSR
jgi:hypothetical protein